MSFNEKVILITDASSSIGVTMTEFFINEGSKLALVGPKTERLVNVVNKIKASGIETAILHENTIGSKQIIDEAIAQFGRLDILINNTEIGMSGSIENMNIIDFDMVMTTNLRWVIELTQKAIPHLEKTKGNIINISSICSITPLPNYLAYCISKSGLDQFTKVQNNNTHVKIFYD